LTWNNSGVNILSEIVTVDVSEKSHDASFTMPSVLNFLITSFDLMFGFTVTPPLAIVDPLNKAGEMY